MKMAIRYVGLTLSTWRQIQFGVYRPDPVNEKRAGIYWNTGLDKLQLDTL